MTQTRIEYSILEINGNLFSFFFAKNKFEQYIIQRIVIVFIQIFK